MKEVKKTTEKVLWTLVFTLMTVGLSFAVTLYDSFECQKDSQVSNVITDTKRSHIS